MSNKYDSFPEMPDPIYDFSLDDTGSVVVNQYRRYTVTPGSAYRGVLYRIHTGDHLVTKYEKTQLDRFLNGHLYSFNGDKNRARLIILDYYQRKADDAKAQLKNAEDMLALMRTPAAPLFPMGGDGDA